MGRYLECTAATAADSPRVTIEHIYVYGGACICMCTAYICMRRGLYMHTAYICIRRGLELSRRQSWEGAKAATTRESSLTCDGDGAGTSSSLLMLLPLRNERPPFCTFRHRFALFAPSSPSPTYLSPFLCRAGACGDSARSHDRCGHSSGHSTHSSNGHRATSGSGVSAAFSSL